LAVKDTTGWLKQLTPRQRLKLAQIEIASMVKVAQMAEDHLKGILAHWKWGLTNAQR